MQCLYQAYRYLQWSSAPLWCVSTLCTTASLEATLVSGAMQLAAVKYSNRSKVARENWNSLKRLAMWFYQMSNIIHVRELVFCPFKLLILVEITKFTTKEEPSLKVVFLAESVRKYKFDCRPIIFCLSNLDWFLHTDMAKKDDFWSWVFFHCNAL